MSKVINGVASEYDMPTAIPYTEEDLEKTKESIYRYYNEHKEELEMNECEKACSPNWEDWYNQAASDVKRLESENEELKTALRVLAKLI